MADLPDLYRGFKTHRVMTSGAEIHMRTGGKGPPLLLLHGYPQTHVCWHKIAPELARHFTLVIPDLRGYGQSSTPAGDPPEHKVYSKREMAHDFMIVMAGLGHGKFSIAGHDRGARIAYRLALDHPDAIAKLALLDILPTEVVWQRATAQSMISAYHWPFLAQPSPLPETLISKDPAFFVEHTLASWTGSGDLSAFDRDALTHYRAALQSPRNIHAVCEDYRAGATYDRKADQVDMISGNKITCPTLALWGTNYVGKGGLDVLGIWRDWCENVSGAEITSGHFLLEENPQDTLSALLPFLKAPRVPT